MSNENNNTVEEPTEETSKLKKFGKGMIAAGWIIVPTVITVASTYYSFKIMQLNYETAKLNNEAAQNNAS